jgi:hypothetical protein
MYACYCATVPCEDALLQDCLMNTETKFHWDQPSAFILALSYGIVLEEGMHEFFSF